MKKSSLTTTGKAKPRSSLKGQRSASVDSDSGAEMHTEDIHELIWRSLPTVQLEVQQYAQRHAAEATATADAADAEEAAPSGTFDDMQVPWSDMHRLVTSLFLATHTNPTQADLDNAVTAVVGTAAEPVQASYTKSDVNAFFDTIPSLWMTLQEKESVSDRQLRQFGEELAKAVTDDESPFALVEPKRILTVMRATTLSTPLAHFVTLPRPPPCAAVFSALWRNLVSGHGPTTHMSLSQFRVFFVWFYALHFENTTPTRSEAAAEYVYRRFRGGSAAGMGLADFEAASRYMTRSYAQRRDTERYLEELVVATHETLQARGMDTDGAVFFSVGDAVNADSLRRKALLDPQTLFSPDELSEWHVQAELYQTPLNANRIFLHGKRGAGKTTAGRALAERLNCAHLDVLALAEVRLAANDVADPLTQQLVDALQDNEPISLELQAALLAHELELRGQYHGYVWSDTFPTIAETADQVTALLQNVGLTTHALPSVFVHLTVDDAVYAERLHEHLAARAASRDAVLNDPVAAQEAQAKARAAQRAECELAFERLVELEGRPSDQADATALEVARAAATAAQRTLEQLNEADAAEAEKAGAADDEEGEGGEDEALDEDELARRAAARHAALRTAKLAMLIDAGRQSLLAPLERGRPEEDIVTVIPVLKKAAEGAATTLSQHLVVDGLSNSADLVAYVVEALQLERCVVATIPALQDADGDASTFAATVAGDEQLGAALEDAATAAGAVPSAVWKHSCPVTFVEDEVLIDGASCYLCVYRGEVYYCASREKRARFMGNPYRYLKATPATCQRTLVVATDRLLACLAETHLNLDVMVGQLADTLHLTRMPLGVYADAVRERRDLRKARKDALMQRRQEFTEERQARDERYEKRMKLEAKKKKKDKRKSDARQATVRFASDVPAGNAGGAPRRKVLIQDTVQERIEDVLAKNIADEKEKSLESVPVLLALLDAAEVDQSALSVLYAERMMPERVLVLDHAGPATRDDDDAEQDRSDAEDEDEEEDSSGANTSASKDEAATETVMTALLQQLEHGAAPTGWKKEDSGLPAQAFTVQRVNVAGKGELELLLEVKQLVSPGAVACKDAEVNEELGNDEEREEDPEEDEEAALAEDGDENFPALPPRPSQNAQALPGLRFLDQFGTRLNYCPVTLHEKRLVVHGKHEYCTDYRGKLYVFASEACLRRFQMNPLKYVNQSPPRDIPPRIWIVGTTHSGRHTLARDLQRSFQIPYFTYDRKFFEACIEATMQPGGAEVSGIHIPCDTTGNPYVARAQKLLKKIRDTAEAEEKGLKLRAEATARLEEQERQAEAAADGSEVDEELAELDEEAEEQLRLQAEYEPEDEEEKQTRLTESYLRIASCVTRFEPFESKGYIMVCPPFSELDQDVLFGADGVPETVVYLRQSAQTFRERAEHRNTALRTAREALELSKRVDPTRRDQAAARAQRRRERQLHKWRRRHIGADDPPSENDDGDAAADKDNASDPGALAPEEEDAFAEMDVEGTLSLETGAIEEFISAVKERQVDVVAIDADRPLETVRRLTREKLHNRLEDRLSFFCACEVVSYETAMTRLEEGRTNLSVFGLHDPVALYETRLGKRRACVRKPDGVCLTAEGSPDDAAGNGRLSLLGTVPHGTPPFRSRGDDEDDVLDGAHGSGVDDAPRASQDEREEEPGDEEEPDELSECGSEDLGEFRARQTRRERILAKRAAPRACQLGCRVFFFNSEHSLLEFMRNPLFFVEQPPFLPALRAKPVLAVYEDDARTARDDGRKHRSAAEHAAFNLHYEFLSVPKLLSWAALHPRLGSLRTRAVAAAMQHTADDNLVSTLLALRLADAGVKLRGAVLLNLPRTPAQCQAVVAAASPIAKVAALVRPGSAAARMAVESVPALQATCGGAIELPVPFPANAADLSNVVEMVHRMDDLERASRELLLRTQNGFPANLDGAYYTQAFKERSVSEYRTYCPYCWAEEGDLVESSASPYRATYLGRLYYFHSALHLRTFLSQPTTVADPATLRPLPPVLPIRRSGPGAEPVDVEDAEAGLACQGCCPVVLYDTRDHRGLRGVLEPVAEPGSLDCLVEYGGTLYALRDEAHVQRFMRRPWQYVDGAAMPPSRKCPLTPTRRQNGVEDEEFVRRQLYDALAQALVAVGTERPRYPGLSSEESALKFVALHMKAHNAVENNGIQDEQYKNQLELFRKRATLYRDTKEDNQLSEEACAEYERLRFGLHKVNEFATLKKVA